LRSLTGHRPHDVGHDPALEQMRAVHDFAQA
jgi:hypothetical protein